MTIENNQKSVIRLNENKISLNFPGEKGQEQVKSLLTKAELKFDNLILAKPKPEKTKPAELEIKNDEIQPSSLRPH